MNSTEMSASFDAKALRLPSPCGSEWAWAVPLRPIEDRQDGLEIVVNLDVYEVSRQQSRWLVTAPFLVDTGSPVTIFPRFLQDNGFRGRPSMRRSERIGGLVGEETTICEYYTALLMINGRRSGVGPPAIIWRVAIGAVSTWSGNFGILGLDAMRQSNVFLDGKYCYIWDKGE
jgi:hypothetical protein